MHAGWEQFRWWVGPIGAISCALVVRARKNALNHHAPRTWPPGISANPRLDRPSLQAHHPHDETSVTYFFPLTKHLKSSRIARQDKHSRWLVFLKNLTRAGPLRIYVLEGRIVQGAHRTPPSHSRLELGLIEKNEQLLTCCSTCSRT